MEAVEVAAEAVISTTAEETVRRVSSDHSVWVRPETAVALVVRTVAALRFVEVVVAVACVDQAATDPQARTEIITRTIVNSRK